MNIIVDPNGATRSIGSCRPLPGTPPVPELVYGEVSGSVAVAADNGVLVETTTGGGTPLVQADFDGGEFDRDARIQSLDPALATADGNCLVVEDGVTSGTILATWVPFENGPMMKFKEEISAPSVVRRSTGYVGGVGKTIGDVVEALLDSGESSPDKNLFSTLIYPGSYARNPSHWASSFDFTGCVVATSNGAKYTSNRGDRGGVAITPRHIACARHWPIPVGSTAYFVDAGDVVHSRTVTHIHTVPYSDRQICLLDSDLPASISPLKLIGTIGSEWPLPSVNCGPTGFLGFWVDQEEKVHLTTTYAFGTAWDVVVNGNTHSSKSIICRHPDDRTSTPKQLADYQPYGKYPINFDSGSPVFVPIGGYLHATTIWHGPNSGGSLVDQEDLLNDIILELDAAASIASGHTVTVTNL